MKFYIRTMHFILAKIFKNTILFTCCLFFTTACNKLIEIPQPRNTITNAQVFSSDIDATSAIMGIYSEMSYAQNSLKFGNGATTIFTGMSSDELKIFNAGSTNSYAFQTNSILITNPNPETYFWKPMYAIVYKTNAVIEGLNASSEVTTETKHQLMGEAKFIRAFCYFYLINLFGDVPLVNSTSWNQVSLMSRTPLDQVYDQIVSDLHDAIDLLITDYSLSNGEKIRANKWAAKALLARVYLFEKNWPDAEALATDIISNAGYYNLESDLTKVFLKNSNEAILQLQTANSGRYSTAEGFNLFPTSRTSSPPYYLTNSIVNAFENGDYRRSAWVDSTKFGANIYSVPAKYKVRQASANNITEYYTLIRFAELFLIRAEARARENTDLAGAINDLNVIRLRAGLIPLPLTLTQDQVFDALIQERRIELFAEWGHRWLDLKRWNIAQQVLSINKGFQISANALLYPIPISEIQTDPKLIQNPGY